jgi:hypothetical protein
MRPYEVLSSRTQQILAIPRLQADLEMLLSQQDTDLVRGKRPSPPTPAANDDEGVEDMRHRLLEVVHKLDVRIAEALSRNNASMVIRYVFLTLLGILVVAAIMTAMATQTLTWGVLGGIVPLPLVGFLLRQLRGLQDERVALLFRIARHEAVVVTCVDVRCLQDAARQIAIELQWLEAISTSEATDYRGTPNRR